MTIQGTSTSVSPYISREDSRETGTGSSVELSAINEFVQTAIVENDKLSPLKDRVVIENITPPKDSAAETSHTVAVSVNLSQMPTLTEKTDFLKNNDLVSSYLNELFYELNLRGTKNSPKLNFEITHINISHNNISGRSLLQSHSDLIKEVTKDTVHRAFKQIDPKLAYLSQTELNRSLYDDTKLSISFVDYSHTKITYRGLKFMFRLPSVTTLKMDYCLNATYIEDPSKLPCKTIKEISLLGASLCDTKNLLKDLEAKFPNLERVDITQPHFDGKDHKYLGLLDIYSEQSTISPHALDCGHIYGRENAGKQLKGGCWLCRKTATKIVDASIFQTRLEKISGTWKVQVIDFHRRPISSPTLYHPVCRQAFNAETIKELFSCSIDTDPLSELAKAVSGETCPGCLLNGKPNKIELMTIYPTATDIDDTEADSQQQESLQKMDAYIAH